MKKKHLFCLFYLFPFFLFSQNVERILQTKDIHTIVNDDEFEGGKGLGIIYTSDLENVININHPYLGSLYKISQNTVKAEKEEYRNAYGIIRLIKNYGYYSQTNRVVLRDYEKNKFSYLKTASGISFFLKKKDGFIFYYVDENNHPAAIDCEGVVYSSEEAMLYLKEYDSAKFEASRAYADEIGILNLFNLNEALVWGNTFYASVSFLNNFYKPSSYLYPIKNHPIVYDLNSIGYQTDGLNNILEEDRNIIVICREGNWLCLPINITKFSTIHMRHILENDFSKVKSNYSVEISGNIYFYISDERETEVFRIRNTWDSTNFYALAINGYTEDFYGDYVKEVLPKMSKVDLRLLRNTIFALYGVHFKSEDLAKYFDKQVWYTDKGLTSGDVTLPAHRQKLVEMIQKLEK